MHISLLERSGLCSCTGCSVTRRLLFSSCRSLSPSALSWCLATPCCSRPSTPPRLSPSGWVGPWSPINCVCSEDKFSWINGSRWSKITDAFVWVTGTAERNGLKYKTLFFFRQSLYWGIDLLKSSNLALSHGYVLLLLLVFRGYT